MQFNVLRTRKISTSVNKYCYPCYPLFCFFVSDISFFSDSQHGGTQGLPIKRQVQYITLHYERLKKDKCIFFLAMWMDMLVTVSDQLPVISLCSDSRPCPVHKEGIFSHPVIILKLLEECLFCVLLFHMQ